MIQSVFRHGNKALLETQVRLEFGTSSHHHPHPNISYEPSVTTDYSTGTVLESADHRTHHPKKCRFEGCSKGAQGALGLCIAHGGQRCQRLGCAYLMEGAVGASTLNAPRGPIS